MLQPVAFDHIVLRCADIETTLAGYRDDPSLPAPGSTRSQRL